MIERVVEDWLTNVNELGYENSFAHALLAQGHTLVHQQEHGPLELGKDLITRDRTGTYHCYQLKGGKIDQKVWQEISGQLHDTVTSPIAHPSVPLGSPFKAYLVTNGTITDPVRIDITLKNLVWERQCGRTLNLITYGNLLRMFLDLQNSFLPSKPIDFEVFLSLYLSNREDQVDSGKFCAFLKSMLPQEQVSRAEIKRVLGATTIVADYIISNYEKSKNYYAAAHSWILLLVNLLRTCELLPPYYRKAWEPTIDLIRQNHYRCVRTIITEALRSTSWMEGNYMVDDVVQPYRQSMLVGMLSAFAMSNRISGRSDDIEDRVFDAISSHAFGARLWGEACAPALFLAAQYLSERGMERYAIDICLKTIDTIVDRNRRSEKLGLPDPYYGADEVMRYELLEEKVFQPNQSFVGHSFAIRQFVEFVIRRQWKRCIEKRWFGIAEIDQTEFVPSIPLDTYLWHTKNGNTETRRWGHPQSYSALAVDASTMPTRSLLIETDYLDLMPYILIAMPHRFTRKSARILDIALLSGES